MRRLAALLVAVGVLAGCSTGDGAVDVNNGGEFRFVAGTRAGEVIPEDERATAPEFSGTLLGGGDFASDELAGDVVVLNFWGSWCAPCEAEMPALDKVYLEMSAEQPVLVIGVGIKNDYEPNALAMIDELGISYPIGRDTTGDDPQRGEQFRGPREE